MSSDPLQEVLLRIDATPRAVVVFDLDSTLVSTAFRHLRILRDFAAAEGDRHAGLAEAVEGLRAEDIGYDVDVALAARGITADRTLRASVAFWRPRFFSSKHLGEDRLLPGAKDFVEDCHGRGAALCYLTARDEARMGRGTRRSLRSLGLPLEVERAHLLLKPEPHMRDHTWKSAALERVAGLGEVVATFENEPGNANLFAGAFPGALHFLLETCHSPSAPPARPEVVRIPDFRRGGRS